MTCISEEVLNSSLWLKNGFRLLIHSILGRLFSHKSIKVMLRER